MTDSFTLAHLSDPHVPPLPVARLRELAGKRVLGYLNWTRNRHNISPPRGARCARRRHAGAAAGPHRGDRRSRQSGAGCRIRPGAAWLESVGTPQQVTVDSRQSRRLCARDAGIASRDAFEPLSRAAMPRRTAAPFPFLRRRGPLALIGVSSAVPTLPLMATGRLGRAQLDALDRDAGATGRTSAVPRAAGPSSAAFDVAA